VSFFKHPHALVESDQIGDGSRIWAFAHVLPGARIGKDCNLCNGVFIENDVVVGDRVTVKCGVQLWDGVRLEDDVFVGPNATFTNDRFPRSRQHLAEYPRTMVGKGASIGANATILPGVTIGQRAMIGAGAVVTRDVPSNAIVVGNPARITGYVDSVRHRAPEPVLSKATSLSRSTEIIESRVAGVKFYLLPVISDLRGDLSAGEFGPYLPFQPKRYFIVFNVPSTEVRGEHAHRTCRQFMVCVRGRCSVMVDDGNLREETLLDHPGIGVYVPPMIWGVQYKYSHDAVLLIFASEHYDPKDYIRDYDDFLRAKDG
jgi:acetyltransferase-like isoleucine patch superfamily enzyme/dTDP-4-dehydrorhamnose 3,5-epimerase-like enzyme